MLSALTARMTRPAPMLADGEDTVCLLMKTGGHLALAGNVGAAAARCIPRETEALSLLRAYMANMPDSIADPQLVRLYATHVYDLISLAIGATQEGRQIAHQRGVRAARREAIKAELTCNPGVSLDRLAAQQGISPRSMLTSPRYETWSVTALALEAGFGDVSHFNRRFKLRFLMMPTDVRAQFGCKRIPATASDAGLK